MPDTLTMLKVAALVSVVQNFINDKDMNGQMDVLASLVVTAARNFEKDTGFPHEEFITSLFFGIMKFKDEAVRVDGGDNEPVH